MERKFFTPRLHGFVTSDDVEDVLLHIFFHDVPGSAGESESFALTYGVEPQSAVLSDDFSRLHIDDVAGVLAEVAAYVVVVVYLAEATDAL